MTKLYRVLGKRGRITIPYEIRRRVGFIYNDVLSFTEQDDRTVVVKREKICDNCCAEPTNGQNKTGRHHADAVSGQPLLRRTESCAYSSVGTLGGTAGRCAGCLKRFAS